MECGSSAHHREGPLCMRCMPSPYFTAVLEAHDLLVVQHPNVKNQSHSAFAATALPPPPVPPPPLLPCGAMRGHAGP